MAGETQTATYFAPTALITSMSFVCSPLDVYVVIYEYAYNWSAHAMLKLHQYNVTLAITRTNERSLEEKLIEE